MTQFASPIARVPLEVPGTGPIVNCKGCYAGISQVSGTHVYCSRCLSLLRWMFGAPLLSATGAGR